MIPLDCTWSGASTRAESRVSDISMSGCYVDCRNVPAPGESVRISMLIAGRMVDVDGVVVHNHPNLGFGVRFTELSADARTALSRLLG